MDRRTMLRLLFGTALAAIPVLTVEAQHEEEKKKASEAPKERGRKSAPRKKGREQKNGRGSAPQALQGDRISPDAAADAARRATGGKVLGVRSSGDDYSIRVLTPSGRLRSVRVDARSGRVLD